MTAETISSWLGIHLPPWLIAVVLGWLVSWALTQHLKFLLPMAIPSELRHWLTRLIGLAIAMVTVLALEPYPDAALNFVLALAVGLWAPTSAALLMAWLKRRHPWIADVLSQDLRGVLRGQPRGGREEDP